MIKVYAKKGKPNYKEKRLVAELQQAIEKRRVSDPEITERFRPANTFEELQGLHRMYASEEVEYTEINKNDMAKKKNVEAEADEELDNVTEGTPNFEFDDDDESTGFIDPFNREEPIVRNYVTDGGISKDSDKKTGPVRTEFDEPVTWEEAFELPNEETPESKDKNSSGAKRGEPKEKKPKPESFNPGFDDMPNKSKKQSTKKFAKYIVVAVCALAEKGFTWFANKDINESKLTEYELNGEIDTSLLLTLNDGQEATVRQFFAQQCLIAEQAAKFEEEEIADMAEALSEVFMEKGIAPTKTQEALIVVAGVLVKKGAMLLALKSQTSAVLAQLRMMNEGNQAPEERYYEPQPQTNAYQPAPEPAEAVSMETDYESPIFELDNSLEIEQVVETKE
jgi:hypothetical protein